MEGAITHLQHTPAGGLLLITLCPQALEQGHQSPDYPLHPAIPEPVT